MPNLTYNGTRLPPQGTSEPFDHFQGTIELYKVLFVLIDGMGIIGNILVISTIFLNPNMRSTIYYLLANLAFSDLLFAVLAPFHVATLLDDYNWKYGATFCRVYYFVFRSFYGFSIMNLILITVERFLATRYPLSFRWQSETHSGVDPGNLMGTEFRHLVTIPFRDRAPALHTALHCVFPAVAEQTRVARVLHVHLRVAVFHSTRTHGFHVRPHLDDPSQAAAGLPDRQERHATQAVQSTQTHVPARHRHRRRILHLLVAMEHHRIRGERARRTVE